MSSGPKLSDVPAESGSHNLKFMFALKPQQKSGCQFILCRNQRADVRRRKCHLLAPRKLERLASDWVRAWAKEIFLQGVNILHTSQCQKSHSGRCVCVGVCVLGEHPCSAVSWSCWQELPQHPALRAQRAEGSVNLGTPDNKKRAAWTHTNAHVCVWVGLSVSEHKSLLFLLLHLELCWCFHQQSLKLPWDLQTYPTCMVLSQSQSQKNQVLFGLFMKQKFTEELFSKQEPSNSSNQSWLSYDSLVQ